MSDMVSHTRRAVCFCFFLWLACAAAAAASSSAAAGDSDFCTSVIQPISSDYTCSEYELWSRDGFRLALHKVELKADDVPQFTQQQQQQINPNVSADHPSVLFLHSGMVGGGGGDTWFASPSPTPLSLAAQGFTSWIAHLRTSKFSHGHLHLRPDQKEYWNWCNDDLAHYDFQAFLKFVYISNGNRSVHVVGYSQGASIAIGAISYQRKAGERVRSVILLAPVVYMRHVISPVLKVIGASDYGMVGYNGELGRFDLSMFSNAAPASSEVTAEVLMSAITGPNCCINATSVYTLIIGGDSHTTYKCIAHLTQCIKLGNYQAFDHQNVSSNRRVYGIDIPPMYRFSNVPTEISILIVYGGNDHLSSPKDIKYLSSQLPSPPSKHFLASYAHLDMIFSNTMDEDINRKILEFIQ